MQDVNSGDVDLSKPYSIFHDRQWVPATFDTLQACLDHVRKHDVDEFAVYDTPTSQKGARLRDTIMWTHDTYKGVVCVDAVACKGQTICF